MGGYGCQKDSLEIVIKQVRLEGGFERGGRIRVAEYLRQTDPDRPVIVQELCESRGGRPGLSVLTSFLVSVDVKIY